jgi:hypothetical protein
MASSTQTKSMDRPGQENQGPRHDELQPLKDMLAYMREYAVENPEVAALTCFGIGFVLGWKLKMW